MRAAITTVAIGQNELPQNKLQNVQCICGACKSKVTRFDGNSKRVDNLNRKIGRIVQFLKFFKKLKIF